MADGKEIREAEPLAAGDAKTTISKSEYELLASFRYALRRFFRFSEEVAEKEGMTPQQYQAMLVIMGFPGRDYVTIGELAERMTVRHHSAVGLVDRMIAQGLVTRARAANNRRQVHVTLTPKGAEVLSRLAAVHKAELARMSAEMRGLLVRMEEGRVS